MPEIAKKISGKTFEINARSREGFPFVFNWESVSLSFDKPDEATLGFTRHGFYRKLPVGLDRTYRLAEHGKYHMPVALRGFWKTDNSFALHFNELGDISNWRITMTFNDDKIVLDMREPTWVGNAIFDGRLRQG